MKTTKLLTILLCLLLGLLCLTASEVSSAQEASDEGLRRGEFVVPVSQSALGPVLATLEGRWQGEGELLDRPAAFSMTWVRSLNGRYLRLEFGNAFTDVEPPVGVLEAHAYYLLGGSTLTGRWMDSRGVMLSIEAEIVGSSLVSTWSGEENGRTEYRVMDEDTVEVTDYVLADDQYYPFATARYRRIR